MQGKSGFIGRGIKKSLTVRTTYDLYDANGEHEAQGIVQAVSLGALFATCKDIDIYDPTGERLGFIDGEVLTTASAKYTFYNQENEPVATAYLDYSCSGFILMEYKTERTIGHLRRNFVENVTDNWDIKLYEPNVIDMRVLKIFSIFAIDFQEYFKEDT